MDRFIILDVTIAAIRVRLDRGANGFVVTRTQPGKYADSVAIRRWRLTAQETAATATRIMDEVLAAGESESFRLRHKAQSAARRAMVGRTTMRMNSAALRLLEEACLAETNQYLLRGRSLAEQCAAVEVQLESLGMPVPERDLPPWISHIFEDPSETTEAR